MTHSGNNNLNSEIIDSNINEILDLSKISEQSNKTKNNEIKDDFSEPAFFKSDKLKFVGKQTKLPVSPMSRAFNFGFLGASIISNSIGNVIYDKVYLNFLFY